MAFDPNKYEKGVGPICGCQFSIQSFIEDTANDASQRAYAEKIYEWLGKYEGTVDDLVENVGFEISAFILKALEKYKMDTKTEPYYRWMNYYEAIDSLNYQLRVQMTIERGM